MQKLALFLLLAACIIPLATVSGDETRAEMIKRIRQERGILPPDEIELARPQPVPTPPPAAPLPPAAEQGRKAYEQQLAWADAQFDMAVADAKRKRDVLAKAAQADYLQKLKTAMDAALKAKELDSVNAINAAIKQAGESQAGGPLAGLEGTWSLTYTNNVRRTYQFNRSGEGRYMEEIRDGRRDRPVLKCQAYTRGKDILLDWGDDKLERVTIVGERGMIEHFSPSERYQNKDHAEIMATMTRK